MTMIQANSKSVLAIVRQQKYMQTWVYPRGPKKPVTDVLRDGQWKGQRCFLIGGGPSLAGFDFERLRGEKLIVVNRGYEHIPFADIMYSMDVRYYRWIITRQLGPDATAKFNSFQGVRVWFDINNVSFGPGVHYVKGIRTSHYGYPRALEAGIYGGNNSGYGALQLALLLGANPIYLLGYDMQARANKTHWYRDYPLRQSQRVLMNFREGYAKLSKEIRAHGVRVINLNPRSALRCFEFSTIDEVLHDKHKRHQEDSLDQPGGGDQSVADHPGAGMSEVRGGGVSQDCASVYAAQGMGDVG